MDPIKEAFSKIKQDILDLKSQLESLNQQIEEIKRTLDDKTPTQIKDNESNQQINSTVQNNPTDNLSLYGLKSQDMSISIGNGGVPTDRQSVRQTDQQTLEKTSKYQKIDKINQIQRVSEVLESLDSIKKELRSNFKQITSQEMAVFSAVYTLEEKGFVVDERRGSAADGPFRRISFNLIGRTGIAIKFELIDETGPGVTCSIAVDTKVKGVVVVKRTGGRNCCVGCD